MRTIEKNNRQNWVPLFTKDRYIVIDKTTNIIINDAQGHGYKSKEKC